MTDADLATIPTFAEMIATKPAFRLFSEDVAARHKSDLWALHEAAGEPAGKSPLPYLAEFKSRWADGEIALDSEGRCLADRGAGLHYLEWLDEEIREASTATSMRASRISPARLVLGSLDPVTVWLALEAIEYRGTLSPVEALKALMRNVLEETSGWDQRQSAAVIAELQRFLVVALGL